MQTPATRREPATSTYHGVEVTEDYRWLEERTDETVAWTAAQNALTREHLDAIPEWPQIAERVATVLRAESTGYSGLRHGGSTYLALKKQPPRQQPFLVAFTDLGLSDERVLLDPNELDGSGKISARNRERFGLFLLGWLGGPDDYVRQHGHPRLRMRHMHVPVTIAQRDAWLRCMNAALDERDPPAEVREFLRQRFAEVADFLRNVAE